MVATVWGIVRSRNLFAVVVLGGIYSFLMATLLVVLDAVDVDRAVGILEAVLGGITQ